MKRPTDRPLTLFEAMCAWGDRKLVTEMLALKAAGADVPFLSLGGVGEDRESREKSRYMELRAVLERSLLDMLLSGKLIAFGYDQDARPDQPMIRIRADRWRAPDVDFRDSSAMFGARKIIEIVVTTSDNAFLGAPGEETPTPTMNAPSEVRLVIKMRDNEVTLDGTAVRLSSRPFGLLVLLAEAARGDSGPISSIKIKQRLWPNSASDRVVSDAIRNLRDRLKCSLRGEFDPAQFIQNRTNLGYQLDLRSAEVSIERCLSG